MSRTFSLYLDFVRFTAAFLVFLWHSRNVHSYDSLWFMLGHESVIIFFVLSGFVIAFCRDQKEKTLTEFTVNRASRIYSVALPTVFITIALDLGSAWLAPETRGAFFDLPAVRIVSSLLFTNELWFVSINLFSNTPYWSLNYEVWYYIAFGLLAYADRFRYALFGLACLIMGPKILLLAPCWWFGVWVYRSTWFDEASRNVNLTVFAASCVAFGLHIGFRVTGWSWDAMQVLTTPEQFKLLTFSRNFLTDYSLAVIIGLNFGAARTLMRSIELPHNLATRAVHAFAATTFALYLLHQPFLTFVDLLYAPLAANVHVHYLLVCLTCLGIIIPFGYYLERTKRYYRRAFTQLAVFVTPWAMRLAPRTG